MSNGKSGNFRNAPGSLYKMFQCHDSQSLLQKNMVHFFNGEKLVKYCRPRTSYKLIGVRVLPVVQDKANIIKLGPLLTRGSFNSRTVAFYTKIIFENLLFLSSSGRVHPWMEFSFTNRKKRIVDYLFFVETSSSSHHRFDCFYYH
jgi:hypothetical protein